MSSFVLFCLPKPFHGHIGLIQRNAIRSWLALDPRPELILMGDEEGIADVAAEFGASHLPEIARNHLGTPLLDDAFAKATARAEGRDLCYINADIILTPRFQQALAVLPSSPCVALGRRVNADITRPLDAADPGADAELLAADGELDLPHALDYFFLRQCPHLDSLPPFAVGRPGWDNWMIYQALHLRLPIIDLSGLVRVIHQRHDHGHVKQGSGVKWEGPEAESNRALAGHRSRLRFSSLDATHLATAEGGLVRNFNPFARSVRLRIAEHPAWRWPLEAAAWPWLQAERARRKAAKRGRPPA